jgi:hypothetical protein
MSAAPAPTERRRPQNPALVPGSLLPQRDLWQQLADSLPAGEVLVILPVQDGPQRRALVTAAIVLQAAGHRVTTLGADMFSSTAIQARMTLAP